MLQFDPENAIKDKNQVKEHHQTRDLTPKARVYTSLPHHHHALLHQWWGVACSVGVAHKWGGGGTSVGVHQWGVACQWGVAHQWGWHFPWGWHISGDRTFHWGVSHHGRWHFPWGGVAYPWGVDFGPYLVDGRWGAASKVSFLVKPLELQYYFAPFSKAAK